ncbi:hypothetical protein NL676_010403 [Syzygium grande]|nr:hypothetical protein NL676_010403 [Syzygium grande]
MQYPRRVVSLKWTETVGLLSVSVQYYNVVRVLEVSWILKIIFIQNVLSHQWCQPVKGSWNLRFSTVQVLKTSGGPVLSPFLGVGSFS